jgi:glycosyltransferase involved in cell wall biosynthesis
MTPFFSFIVACCDVEPYIEECLRSVLDQPFQDWECLIGIEESKDRTEEVIREMTAGDSRFKIFTGPRTGSCSASRNTGTDMAQGEYVIFLDGDDTIEPGCLSRIHDKICERPGADLYPCAIVTHDEIGGTNEIRDNYRPDAPAEMTGLEATLYLAKHWQGAFCPMLQLSVHRRGFLIEHDLKCIHGLRNQDSEFSPRALYFAKRVVPIHEPFYIYRIRENSVQGQAQGLNYFKKDKDWAVITGSLLEFYRRVSKEPGFDPRVTPCWIQQWLSRMNLRWFHPATIKALPRERRVETLKTVFAKGFEAHCDMLKHGSRAQRIAGFWVRVFVKHPSMRWAAELFFRLYFRLMERTRNRGASQKGFRTEVPQ